MAHATNTLDVFVNGEKKGQAYDVNPVVITTDVECKKLLLNLKSSLTLNKEQTDLLDQCISVVSAKDGDDVSFGPVEIITLSQLAETFPDKAAELMACSQHLSESVDCDGELPQNIYLSTALAYGALSDLMAAALRSGPIVPGQLPSMEEDVSDEDFEEQLSDDE